MLKQQDVGSSGTFPALQVGGLDISHSPWRGESLRVEIPIQWEDLHPGRLHDPPFALKWGKVESLEKPFLFTAKALKLCSVGSCKIKRFLKD